MAGHQQPLVRFSDLLGNVTEYAEAANMAHRTGTPRGPVTCIPSLTRALGGCLEVGTHVVLGAPGAGKTAFVMQTAAQCGFPSLFVTCEMSPRELLFRHTARVLHDQDPRTRVTLSKLKSGSLSPEQVLDYVRQGIRAAPKLCLVDATRDAVSPSTIAELGSLARGDEKHLLIVIDSLHSWVSAYAEGLTEYEALGAGILALNRIAAELRCPVLYISERNRAHMKNGGQSSGAGNRKIEYGCEAELDMGLDPDNDAQKPDENGFVSYPMIVRKNRHGGRGREVQVKFLGPFQKFVDLEEGVDG